MARRDAAIRAHEQSSWRPSSRTDTDPVGAERQSAAAARLDADLRHLWASPGYARLLHTSPEALEGVALDQLLDAEAVHRLRTALAGGPHARGPLTIPLSGRPCAGALEVHRAGGELLVLLSCAQPAPGAGDEGEGVDLYQVLAVLTHELRNPLTAVNNALGLMRRAAAAEHQAWAREAVLRNAEAMNEVLERIADLSRLGRHTLALSPEPVLLSAMVEQAVADLRPLAEAREQRVRVRLPADPAWLHGEPARLGQMLSQLLRNALQYSPAGGLIEVSATVTEGTVQLRVQDNGMGLASGTKARIFEPFVKDTDGHSGSGLGIGLALVKGLAELHGGAVRASSPGPGRGSTFELSLPRAPVPLEQTS